MGKTFRGKRGRLIPYEFKKRAVYLIREAVENGARKFKACEVIGVNIRTVQNWEKRCRPDDRKGAAKRIHRKLSVEEREQIIKTACSEEYKDSTPYEIVADLAEKGVYLASERTFYRVLKENGFINHRENTKKPKNSGQPPELKATGPDQVWCWDITWLKSSVNGLFYYAYTIIDIWTKEIVGWAVHDTENEKHAAELFSRLKHKYDMHGVFLHSDNGHPMKGVTLLMKLYNLGVIPSYSRPRVSNDNPYIESFFKTLKYTPGYPGNFKSIDDARKWVADFINWYNTERKHPTIGYVTPEQRRTGVYKKIFDKRNITLKRARSCHPERWVGKQRKWKINDSIYLNPTNDTKLSLLKKIA